MPSQRPHRGVTLTELLVVVMIVGLIATLASINLFGVFHRETFMASVQDFVDTLEMAGYAATESDRRYAVIVDREEGTYLLRQIANGQLYHEDEVEIVDQASFAAGCRVLEVRFDDGDYLKSDDARAHFVAGHAGWMYGGKIVLENAQGEIYSVVVNRLNKKVRLLPGNVDLPEPRDEQSMAF
jgi:prepilin-type N-terminal cleavage/methylation domain-containing protein